MVLTTSSALTTSVFSAGYIRHELETGRLDAAKLRFYHAMYQAFIFTMLLALVANNLGVMWVAVEGATLTTALMISLYRTRESIEAAWKYFILCGVGIALALFGTILMYLAAQPVMGGGMEAMAWASIIHQAGRFDPALLNLAFVFLLVGYGTKVGLAPCMPGGLDAHAEGPTPISAVLSGLLLNVALYAVLRSRCCWPPIRAGTRPHDDHLGLSSLLSPPSCSTGGATSSACSPIPRSSIWELSCLPSASAARWPISPGCCT